MASLKPSFNRFASLALKCAYVLTVATFLWICSEFYLPGKGFTALVRFGSNENVRYVPALKAINHYEEEDTNGYDAQYYAQIAMRPWLSNPALGRAVDSLPYRARRILFCWTAYGLALGDQEMALHIYAVQNIASWLVLAVLLLHWFPASSWGNFFRWFSVLFSFGLCLSVRGSLVDGPSLLLIAVGMLLAERGRTWWSAAALGIAGLGKETNVLAGAVLAPAKFSDFRGWLRAIPRLLLVVLPLAAWLYVLYLWLGTGANVGARNFDRPFFAYFRKWREIAAVFKTDDAGSIGVWSALIMIALTTQWFFFALRPRWQEPWWRVGAGYAALLVILGDAVWEGYPGAAARVLLPMVLAFNILVPRGRRWWLVLLLGNATIFFSSDTLKPPGRESFRAEGPRALRIIEPSGKIVEAIFSDTEWYGPERSRFDYWRWSRGPAKVILRNPHPFALTVDVTFDLKSNDQRQVVVKAGERVLWSGGTIKTLQGVSLPGVRLPPGDTVWNVETDVEAAYPSNGDLRKVAFSLRNLKLVILGKAADEAVGN